MLKFGGLCIFLSVFRKLSYSFSHEGQLVRNVSFDNILPSQASYYTTFSDGVSLIECSLQCILLNSACARILYNNKLWSCKLLKCYLNEGLIDRTNVEFEWEFRFKKNLCPVGWVPYDRHCYYHSENKENWNVAKAQCERHGARLVEIETPAENSWILKTFITPWNSVDCPNWHDCCETWIGATDMDNEGVFTWNRRKAVDFTNWNKDQPDNFQEPYWDRTGQHCVRFCRNGLWDDEFCVFKKTFLCEKE